MSSARTPNRRGLAPILTLIVFANAVLLFSVEPMFSKMVLPLLGGTPSVWNTCLVFFQAALLVGYGYAHALTRIRNPKRRTAVHVAVLAVSCLALPLSIRVSGDPPPGNLGILWLFMLLTASLGAPFVVLSSGAPLAQRWLADSGHRDAANPYFLYAASNLGSLFALLSYPVLVEPWLTLSAQRGIWTVGYAMLVVLIALCFTMISLRSPWVDVNEPAQRAMSITGRQKSIWVIYASVPASLLVGVTTFISTDVAAVPLLWVLPLSIYLLSFVIVFSRRPIVPHSWMLRAAPHALVIVAIPVFWNVRLPGVVGVVVHLIVLFIVSMVCHGELARRRPPATQVTEFFVWVAVGGLVGGALTALLAPVFFNRTYEYPIVLALAGMLLRPKNGTRRIGSKDARILLAFGGLLFLITIRIAPLPGVLAIIVSILFGVVVFSFRERPTTFGLALATVFAAGYLRDALTDRPSWVIDSQRSYFGVYRVVHETDPPAIKLYHGTTLHGAQSLDPRQRLAPLTYYHPSGPAADVFRSTAAGMMQRRTVAVVGLGAGSLSCYGRPGERWTYYEIDPVVAQIALDSSYFTFLRDCPPSIHITLGDARLTLNRATAERYDILVLDAFSSDAIPVHLITREAMRGYLARLASHGVIAVHISNNHLDLEPVIAALANELGLTARIRRDVQIPESDARQGRSAAVWTVLARSGLDLGGIEKASTWEPLRSRADVSPWTDDYSNIIRVFKWQ